MVEPSQSLIWHFSQQCAALVWNSKTAGENVHDAAWYTASKRRWSLTSSWQAPFYCMYSIYCMFPTRLPRGVACRMLELHMLTLTRYISSFMFGWTTEATVLLMSESLAPEYQNILRYTALQSQVCMEDRSYLLEFESLHWACNNTKSVFLLTASNWDRPLRHG